MGRPSAADKQRELIETVFDRHANGEPLIDICTELSIKPADFRSWMRKAGPEMQVEWKTVKDEYVHSLFSEIHKLERQLATQKYGKEDGAKVQALRAAIDALKHITGRLNPNQYGEQKAGAQGVTVIINSTLPLDKPAETIDGDFKVVMPVPQLKGPNE